MMTFRARSLLTLVALPALPLPAAAQEMCAALNRIAAAANEPVPFASLEGVQTSLVPGYRHCRVDTPLGQRIGAIYCHSQMAPKSLIAETVGAHVQACLGGTMSIPQEWPDNDRVYRTANLEITVESRCDERCHVGRIASLRIVRRREGDGRPAR